KMVLAADKKGFQIGVHAIGDKGNNWVLNAYEKAQTVNRKSKSTGCKVKARAADKRGTLGT
ncbi:MAG TPA: hypothetical protein VHO68_01725, partial [Bacteroidales bacterium]|nr:hypothetical protein [Bacteroidales bacterium]